MLYSYYIGLDLGQVSDYSALTIIEEPVWAMRQWHSPATISPPMLNDLLDKNFVEGRPPHPPLQVRHLERFELGTPYPQIVGRVASLMRRTPLLHRRVALLVDKTGVGGAVVDMFNQSWLEPIAVTIHGGSTVSRDDQRRGYRVPKRDLVGSVQVLLQNRWLKVASGLPMAATLRTELANFRIKIDPRTAHDSYEHWREAAHDDLVLATAMPCWYRQWYQEHLELANSAEPLDKRETGTMTYRPIVEEENAHNGS